MRLKIDIKKELDLLNRDKTYIMQIVKLAQQNWHMHTDEVKNLLEAILLEINGYSDRQTFEEIYVKIIICLEWYYIVYSKYKEGTNYGLKAYEICERRRWEKDRVRICNILLITYMKQGLFEKAINYGVEGLELVKRYADNKSEATLILNIMELYIGIREYDKALQLITYLKQLDYKKDEGYTMFIESALAEIKLHKRQMEEAMMHCEKAYAYAMKLKDMNTLAEILYIRAQIHTFYNRTSAADADFMASDRISRANNYKELIIKGIIVWCEEKIKYGIIEDIEDKLREAIDLADQINALHLKVQVYETLEKLYTKVNDWQSAYGMVKQKEACRKERELYRAEDLWVEKLEQRVTSEELKNYKRLYNQMQQISKVGQNITANLELNNMIDLVYEQVNELLPADMVYLGMRKKNGDFDYRAYSSEGEVIQVNKNLYDRAIRLGNMTMYMDQDLLINDGDFSKYFNGIDIQEGLLAGPIQSAIVTRLKIENVCVGVIGIGNYRADAYSKNDLRSLQILGSYLAVALRNANLFNEVEYMAMYDALTDIYNRRTVLERGRKQFEKNKLLDQKTVVIMLDIDNFKQINDKNGHIFGDKVLKKIGCIFRDSTRNGDILGRYGGEEFLIVLSYVDLEEGMKIAERIRTNVSIFRFKNEKEEEVAITVSCGLYLCKEEKFEACIKKADEALYQAKLNGRNRIAAYV
ncbi:sensor domain-containing diguanylate cyclase [Cellulosilyticum ruminicola]|uniref:sensor domain-containing diguanylate cyclase n=1 Tax=Cellulosilyticum ruminicola TaxID=425254 RepID=UPI0006D10971|nr:sensor domain-containing diguanylate cyclase [Cellulosilyticum ruminicola]